MNFPLTDIVITGFSAVTSAGSGLEPVLALIRSGRDALTPVPAEHACESGGRWGKALGFKATDFIPPLKGPQDGSMQPVCRGCRRPGP